MRFIFNFFFFGILFYLIWMFFPDAFLTLVSWANHVVAFFKDLILGVWNKVSHTMPPQAPISPPTTPSWLIMLPLTMIRFRNGNQL